MLKLDSFFNEVTFVRCVVIWSNHILYREGDIEHWSISQLIQHFKFLC
jgi:hypothetical protein